MLAIYAFGRWEAHQGQESGAIIARADQALAAGKAYRTHQALLQATAKSLADSAARYRQQSRLWAQRLAALDTALGHAQTARDTIPVLLAQAEALRGQVGADSVATGKLLLAIQATTQRAERAEARVAELEANLTATLEVAECHLLGAHWLPRCPSRTAMFFLGAGGATAAFVLTRH